MPIVRTHSRHEPGWYKPHAWLEHSEREPWFVCRDKEYHSELVNSLLKFKLVELFVELTAEAPPLGLHEGPPCSKEPIAPISSRTEKLYVEHRSHRRRRLDPLLNLMQIEFSVRVEADRCKGLPLSVDVINLDVVDATKTARENALCVQEKIAFIWGCR